MGKMGGMSRAFAPVMMILTMAGTVFGFKGSGLGTGSGTSSSHGKAKVGGAAGYVPAKKRRGKSHGSISRMKMKRHLKAASV